MTKIKQIFLLLSTFLFISGCSSKDDIDEIFVSGKWTVVNYFTTTNWKDTKNSKPQFTTVADVTDLKKLTITFNNNGTFIGSLTNGETVTGTWQADGKHHTVLFPMNDIQTNGMLNAKDVEFVTLLKEAKFYQGDASNLLFGIETKTFYVQLTHY